MRRQRFGCIVDEISARLDAGDILFHRLRVDADHQVDAATAAKIAFETDPDLIPCRQALNVGGKEVLASLQDKLDINVGETTEDRHFSLEVGRCFGACGLAPVVMVNDDVHQRVKPSKIKELLAEYQSKENN